MWIPTVLSVLLAAPSDLPTEPLRAAVAKHQGEMESLYRWLHQHPELSGEEVQTAARMAQELRALGATVYEGVGGTGVVGILANRKQPQGPVVLMRADMDALPVQEATGASFASQNDGVMHACGHDIHMSTAIGALRVLRDREETWSGTVMFVAQPAEEIGVGARAMLRDPEFGAIMKKHGRPSVAVALHDSADAEAGQVGIRSGWAFANVDSVDLFVYGRGGHGARPHQTIDPIVMSSEIVLALQTIVSRRVAPGTPAVITVGAFNAGTKHNIIPPEAHLQLTVRSYGDEDRQMLLREIEHIARSVAKAHRAPKDPKVVVRDEHTPAAFNDEALSAHLLEVFAQAVGKENVVEIPLETVGEDFGRFAKTLKIPGVQYRLGGAPRGSLRRPNPPGLHSDRWLPDAKNTIETGMLTLSLAIIEAGAFIGR